MLEQFLHLPAGDRRDILLTATTQLGQQQAIVLEKDVWVCWTLHTLFYAKCPSIPCIRRRHILLEDLRRHQSLL
jgi:hypothetical protein